MKYLFKTKQTLEINKGKLIIFILMTHNQVTFIEKASPPDLRALT